MDVSLPVGYSSGVMDSTRGSSDLRSLYRLAFPMAACFAFLAFGYGQSGEDAPPEGNTVPIPETKFDDINDYVTLVQSGFERSLERVDAHRKAESDQLNEHYLRQLAQIQKSFSDSGDAKGALTTRDEMDRIRSGKETVALPEDEDLKRLHDAQGRYEEARKDIGQVYHEKVAQLIEIGNEALGKRASELTRKGDLDRVAALTELIPIWTGRPDLIQEVKRDAVVKDLGEGDFLAGKRINYPHETKQDSIVSVVFHGGGQATYIGLGGVERPWSYKMKGNPNEYLFWQTGKPERPDWQYSLQIHPGGRTGTVSREPSYRVEAKIRN